jgi:hypothetical protein
MSWSTKWSVPTMFLEQDIVSLICPIRYTEYKLRASYPHCITPVIYYESRYEEW